MSAKRQDNSPVKQAPEARKSDVYPLEAIIALQKILESGFPESWVESATATDEPNSELTVPQSGPKEGALQSAGQSSTSRASQVAEWIFRRILAPPPPLEDAAQRNG